MTRRRNRKRRKARKKRAEEQPSQPLPTKHLGFNPRHKEKFKGTFRGGTELELHFSPTVVKVEDPSDPTQDLVEKTKIQEALEEDLPDSVH
jgi:hypothetical protein